MKCQKCNAQIKNDSAFCSECGVKIETSKIIPQYEEFQNHLEFLGYEVDIIDSSDRKFLTAKHQKEHNMFFVPLEGKMLIKSTFLAEKLFKDSLYKEINEANKQLEIKVYIEKNEDNRTELIFESWYVGDYNKQKFSLLINDLKNNISTFINSDYGKAFLN